MIVSDKGQREKLEALLPDNPWVKAAPVFLVFCGNNRRHRLLFEWRGRPFVNDYLDPFFNAAVDAGIVLATFIAGGRPGRAGQLPDQRHPQPCPAGVGHPVAARPCLSCRSAGRRLAVLRGRDEPAARPRRHDSPRPLRRGRRCGKRSRAYDKRREAVQPYSTQRYTEKFGESADMAGRRTRPGNIRCRSGPISALSCAARASSSTDLPLDLLQDIDPKRAGEIGRRRRAAPPRDLVDLRHQRVERQVRGPGRAPPAPARTRPPAKCWSGDHGW